MTASARTLRAQAEQLLGRPELTEQAQDERDWIMEAATRLLMRNRLHSLNLGALAHAIQVTPGAIRRFFTDLDGLLGAILIDHLDDLASEIAKADSMQAARRLYLRCTRTQDGLAEPHHLLVHARRDLPDDLLAEIEKRRAALGEALAGRNGAAALTLLDEPAFDERAIEQALRALPAAEPRAAAPAEPPRPSAPHKPRRAEEPRITLPFTPAPAKDAPNWLLTQPARPPVPSPLLAQAP